MRGYKLWAAFYSPLVYFEPPMLDAMVAYALQLCYGPEIVWRDPQHQSPVPGLLKLPEVLGFLQELPLATTMQPEGAIEYLDSWKRHFEFKYTHWADFGPKRKRSLNVAAAPYRSYFTPAPAKVLTEAWWGFIGRGPEILALLENYLWGVGKGVAAGFGVVEQWRLEPWDWEIADLLRLRPVPVDMAISLGIAGIPRLMAWRPPYWDRRNYAQCIHSAN